MDKCSAICFHIPDELVTNEAANELINKLNQLNATLQAQIDQLKGSVQQMLTIQRTTS